MIDQFENLKTALRAAQAAAQIIERNFLKTKKSHVKDGFKGLVTETDLEADKAIKDILKKNSDFPILSEESGLSGNSNGPIWVIDPLDGTNNFSRSIPIFGTSIGLIQGNKSLLGVIIDPVYKKEYYAEKGNGAFCNGKKIELPKFDTGYLPMVFLNHGYSELHRGKFKEVTKILAASYDTLKLGTTAIELCMVATGSVDAFISVGDELWDFAAGMIIAQESGCIFSDWKGNPWDGKTNYILVARPEIHTDLVEKIEKLQVE